MLLARQPTARCSSLLWPGRDGPPGQPGVHRQLIERTQPPRGVRSGTGLVDPVRCVAPMSGCNRVIQCPMGGK